MPGAHAVQVLEYVALSSSFTILVLKEEFSRSFGGGTVNKVMLLFFQFEFKINLVPLV